MQSLQGEVLALLVVAESSYTEFQHYGILPQETRLILQWRDNNDLWRSSVRHNGSKELLPMHVPVC